MRLKLDIVANVVIIAAGTALIANVIMDRSGRRLPRVATPTPYATGDVLPDTPFEYGSSGRTLFLFVSDHCPYCDSSLPFYRRLGHSVAARGSRNLRLVVLATADVDVSDVSGYLRNAGVQVDRVLPLSQLRLRLTGTPTLLLADSQRRVLQLWPGRLTEARASEVLNMVDIVGPRDEPPGSVQ